MGKLKTYKDYADNDYDYYSNALKSDDVPNSIGATCQQICERYLKHIIDQYYDPQSDDAVSDKKEALRSHSLKRLMHEIDKFAVIDTDTKTKLQAIDGFYFLTRYPGDDSIEITKSDVIACAEAIDAAKAYTESYIKTVSSNVEILKSYADESDD